MTKKIDKHEIAQDPKPAKEPQQLIIYNGTHVFTFHKSPEEHYTLQKGENLVPVDVWNNFCQRTDVKIHVQRGTMIDKGLAPDGYKPKPTEKKAKVKGTGKHASPSRNG